MFAPPLTPHTTAPSSADATAHGGGVVGGAIQPHLALTQRSTTSALSHRQHLHKMLAAAAAKLSVQWHYKRLSKHHTLVIDGRDPAWSAGVSYYFGVKARAVSGGVGGGVSYNLSAAAAASGGGGSGGGGGGGGGGGVSVGFRITITSHDTVTAPLVTKQKVCLCCDVM
jgi:hypothetical protein